MKINQNFHIAIDRRWPAQKLGLPPTEERSAQYNSSFTGEVHTPLSSLEGKEPDILWSEVVQRLVSPMGGG